MSQTDIRGAHGMSPSQTLPPDRRPRPAEWLRACANGCSANASSA